MLLEYETPRLILRVLHKEWAPQLLDFLLRDREQFELYEADRQPGFYTIEHQENILASEFNLICRSSLVRFYVFLKEDPNTIIGTVSFRNICFPLYSSCELGYKFSSFVQHQGYATEAIQKGISVIFNELKLHRVMAWVSPDNTASIRLLERLSFEKEALCREHTYLHGKWTDHLQYALIQS